jgi:HNH endonuclease
MTRNLFALSHPSSTVERMFGNLQSIVSSIRDINVAGLDAESVQAGLAAVSGARGAMDAVEARLVARADELAALGDGAGGHDELVRSGTLSSRQARLVAGRAMVVDDVPALGDALGRGEIGSGHIDAAARAARGLDDSTRCELLADKEVLDAARRLPVEGFDRFVKKKAKALVDEQAELDHFERQRAQTRLAKWVKADGMHVLNLELDPEAGSRVFRAIDAEVETMAQRDGCAKNDHSAGFALAALVQRGIGAGPNPTPAEVIVIDVDTMRGARHDYSTSETSSGAALPVDAVRRAACEAVMVPTVLARATGAVLDAGRTTRVATRAQRRTLRAMYPTCAFPGCDRSFDWCQIHHIVPWEQGGPSDLANLLPLCSHHHHLVHEGGWRLSLDAARTLTIRGRGGDCYAAVPLPSVDLARALGSRRKRRSQASRDGPSRLEDAEGYERA